MCTSNFPLACSCCSSDLCHLREVRIRELNYSFNFFFLKVFQLRGSLDKYLATLVRFNCAVV